MIGIEIEQGKHLIASGQIEEVVNVVNQLKNEGVSVDEIGPKYFGISRKALGKKLKESGYKYNASSNLYEKADGSSVELSKDSHIINVEPVFSPVEKRDLETSANTSEDVKTLLEGVYLRLDRLEKELAKEKASKTKGAAPLVEDKADNTLRPIKSSKPKKHRMYTTYDHIDQAINDLVEELGVYTKQDVVNTLLYEALSKYTKVNN